jgi:REP element-mobilizing transposase RayT
MARKPRLEREHGTYHLINRGNYRREIFADDRTRRAFLQCVDETHRKTGWRTFGLAVMINHYHFATLTPQPNLVAGMKWLQGTFGMRFNGLRAERGHLFQGRYKSILLDPETRLGPTCHYIHLNPVRAGLVTVGDLADYPWTSMRWLMHPGERPEWFDPRVALQHAGSLKDTRAGRHDYLAYLRRLMDDQTAQKEMGFANLEQGWVQGSREFLQQIVRDYGRAAGEGERSPEDLRAAQEALHGALLDRLLGEIGRSRTELEATGKSEEWKVAIAAALKLRSTVTNRWLSAELCLGHPSEVGRNVAAWTKLKKPLLDSLVAAITPQPTA